MKHILITGGAGFIGSNLTEYFLGKGYFVRCLDNFSTGYRHNIEGFLEHECYELVEGDIRDLETCKQAVRGMDYVLHQAALGSVPRSVNVWLLVMRALSVWCMRPARLLMGILRVCRK